MICQTPRDLPALGKLLEQPDVKLLVDRHGDALVKLALRDVLERARGRLLDGQSVPGEGLVGEAAELLEPAQKRVLNLTGTVLHTNLGRAPLGDMLGSVAERLRGYSVLEYDLHTGKRGKRGESVERLLRWLTGAPAALMVNNCASAMLLLLTALAKGKEVIVSRGELVEIGGSFRVPDILELSGARLVEVGTTNRTRIADYERAITENTGLLLCTHRSNFEIVGFTESPGPSELVALGARHGIPVVHDLGSGMLTRVVEGEPTVGESQVFDLTAFSGDKLFGGPQCGVISGRAELVTRCRKHPFYRALRCDKLTLAIMEEALRRHAEAPQTVPTVELLAATLPSLRRRAEALFQSLQEFLPASYRADVVDTIARVGGGSLPGGDIPSVAIAITPLSEGSEHKLQCSLRECTPPIIGRLDGGRLLLDLRSLPAADDEEFFESIRRFFT